MEATAIMNDDQAARGRQEAGRLGGDARPPTSSTPRTTRSWRCPASPSRSDQVPGDIEAMLIKNDFAWAAANRERILAEWSKRYDGKSEPKS